ncbi:MAG TPA: CDP-diacylglycerol--glycerol-3-phosphate 3-phosphatidyltransferase [Gaiellaceae bacterium]|nr:CDP-diacylglycerol--glycerol-3-phosphate 3-phosphatidyltransferase [Gaiellaceae bacterium]
MATSAVPAPLAQLPNALTILRLALIPLFVGLMLADDPANWPAGIVFAVAGVTDQIDGWLARRWQVESDFGKIADPLADRLMIDAAAVMLWVAGRVPWYAAAVILARDLALVAGYKLVVPRGYSFEVNRLGKIATWGLYASLTFLLLTDDDVAWPLWLFWIALALALLAAAQYVLKARREVRT